MKGTATSERGERVRSRVLASVPARATAAALLLAALLVAALAASPVADAKARKSKAHHAKRVTTCSRRVVHGRRAHHQRSRAQRCTPPRRPVSGSSNAYKVLEALPDGVTSRLGDPSASGMSQGFASLPSKMNGPVTVMGPSGAAGWTQVGAPASTGYGYDHGTAYQGAGYAVAYTQSGDTLKEQIAVTSRQGQKTWTWHLTTPQAPTLLFNGGVDLHNGLFIPAPLLTDAGGVALPGVYAHWDLSGQDLSLTLNDAALPLPYIIDPGAAPIIGLTGFVAGPYSYVDPSYSLSRIFYNPNQSGSFQVQTSAFDPENDPFTVTYPGLGGGWTGGGAGTPLGTSPGLLGTYYDNSCGGGGRDPGNTVVCAVDNVNDGACSQMTGLRTANFTGIYFSRVDPVTGTNPVDQTNTASTYTPYPQLGCATYSIIWDGQIYLNAAGNWYFQTYSDDGIKVEIDGIDAVQNWTDHAPTVNTSCNPGLNLTAGWHNIRVKYYEWGGNSVWQLRFRRQGTGNTPGGGCSTDFTEPNTHNYTSSGTFTGSPSGANTFPVVSQTDTRTAGNNYTMTYSWTPNPVDPAAVGVTASDGTPSTSGTFDPIPDGNAPTQSGGTVSQANGSQTSTSASPAFTWNGLTFTDGAAGAVSGVDATTARVVRIQSNFDNSNNTCDPWPSWTTAVVVNASPGTSGTYNAAGLTSGQCYHFAYAIDDNVGNTLYLDVPGAAGELRIDNTPPAAAWGSFTEGTNPQYQYAVGTVMYFNPAQSGNFTVTLTGSDAASGMKSMTLPNAGGAWTSGGGATILAPGPYTRTYSWNAGAGSTGVLNGFATDQLNTNSANVGYQFTSDNSVPTATLTNPNGFVSSKPFNVPWTQADTGSGVDLTKSSIDRGEATLDVLGNCIGPYVWTNGITGPPLAAAGTWVENSAAVTAGHCYMYRINMTDNVGNTTTFTGANVTKFDNVPPTFSALVWSEASNYLFASGTNLFYNPTNPGGINATLTGTATDASGMSDITYQAMGAGWGGPAPNPVFGAGPNFATVFTLANGATGAGTFTATASDTSGNTSTLNYSATSDGTAPTTSVPTVPAGPVQAGPIVVTLGAVTDAGSGVGGWSVYYQVQSYANGACSGAYGPATLVTSGVGAAPATVNFNPAATGCYHFRVDATDNVNNMTTGTYGANVKVDMVNPAGTWTAPASGATVGGTTVTLSGTATDNESGVTGVVVKSGATTLCTATLAGGPPNWTWSCTWNSTMLADGTYNFTATITDASGRTGTTTQNNIKVDNSPPAINSVTWSEASPYLFVAGTRLWYNPTLGVGAVGTLNVNATDAGGSMGDVTYPNLAAPWGNPAPNPVLGAGPNYAGNYTVNAGVVDPATQQVVAHDSGGNPSAPVNVDLDADGTGPVALSVTQPTSIITSLSYNVTAGAGNDGTGSGIAQYGLEFDAADYINGACVNWNGFWTAVDMDSGTAGVQPLTGGAAPASIPINLSASTSICIMYRLTEVDNVGNQTWSAASPVRPIDLDNPTVSITAPAAGSNNSGIVNITGMAGDDLILMPYTNGGSGLQSVSLTYQKLLPLPAGAVTPIPCSPVAVAGASSPWNCNWNTGALPDGTYRISAQSKDISGRVSTWATVDIVLDNQAPIANFYDYQETPASPYVYWAGPIGNNVVWFAPNAPAGSYSFDARITASDAGSGIGSVTYPNLGVPGWTAGGAGTAIGVPANGYRFNYTFTTSGAGDPAPNNITVKDGAGNTTLVPFDIQSDSAAPVGNSISVTGATQSTQPISITYNPGTDAQSGSGAWTILAEQAPLSGNSCGAFLPWGNAGTGSGSAPGVLVWNAPITGCWRFAIQSADNVSNGVQSPWSATQKVDLGNPTNVTFTAPLNGSTVGSPVAITGTADDAETGIASVKVDWNRAAPVGSGPACTTAATTVSGGPTAFTWSCTWTPPAVDGVYTLTATATDLAGRTTTSTISVTVDTQPPVANFHSYIEATPYAYWAGPILTNSKVWFNPNAPAGAYNIDLVVQASDAGSGISSVNYPPPGAGWNVGGLGTVYSPPVANGYKYTYTFNGGGVAIDPPTLNVAAKDGALNTTNVPFDLDADTTAPNGGSVTPPSGYQPSTTLAINMNGGTDLQSGIGSFSLERQDATLAAGVCTWSGTWTPVLANTGAPPASYNDPTAVDQHCYMYQLVVWDNVQNQRIYPSGNVAKLDLTPPTGSIVLAEGTNPAYQYLANPTKIYVNTNTGFNGDFTATVNAAAASGVLDITFPALGTNWAGNIVAPASPATATYSWTGGATTSNPGTKNAVVRSNSLGSLNLPFDVIADTAGPSGGTLNYNNGYQSTLTDIVTFTVGADALSGLQDYWLERSFAPLAAGACGIYSPWNQIGVNGELSPYTDPTLASGFCYRYRVAMIDNVGNVGYFSNAQVTKVDATPPTGATVTLTPLTNVASQYVSGTTLFYNGNTLAAGTFRADVAVVDAESGTTGVLFPCFGGTWTPVCPPTNDVTAPFQNTYGFPNGSAVQPGAQVATASNGVGLTAPANFTITQDSAAPAAGTISYPNGFDTGFSIPVTFANGAGDGAGSGMWHRWVERHSAAYNVGTGTCGVYNAWARVAPFAAYDPAPGTTNDTTVTQPTCYQWRLVEQDNVGNQTITCSGGCAAPDTAIEVFDVFPPQDFTVIDPINPALPAITTGGSPTACEAVPTYGGATPALTWNPSNDLESGMQRYDVYIDGAVNGNNPFPPGATSYTPGAALSDGAHTWGVRAYDVAGNWKNNTNGFPHPIRIDTTPPTANLGAPADMSYTNNTTPTFNWVAADQCVARVRMNLFGPSSYTDVASGSETNWTPPLALPDGVYTWNVDAIDTLNRSTTSATHQVTVDTVPPTAFAITSPPGGTFRGFLPLVWSAATDATSGVASYKVYLDGTLKTTVGAATLNYTINPLSSGAHLVHVVATDNAGNTTQTADVAFTGYPAIPGPTLISPANGAKINAVPTMQWTWPSDGGPAPTDYDIQTAPPGCSVWTTVVSAVPYAVGTMSSPIPDPGDGSWCWRVVQHDTYTGTVNSSSRTFTLDRTPPNNPGPITRPGVPNATTLTWPAPSDPAAPVSTGIVQQQVWMDDGMGYTMKAVLGGAATSYDFGGLALPDGVYSFKLRAYDGTCNPTVPSCSTGNWTETPPFVVTLDATPPTAFTIIPPVNLALPAITTGAPAPACGATPTYRGGVDTVAWNASTDAVSGLDRYDVYLDGVVDGSTPAPGTTYNPGAVAAGAHAVKVRAYDNFGNATYATPNPLNARWDNAAPSASVNAPANGSFTNNTTPTYNWTTTDDNCVARVEVYVDGALVATASGTESSWNQPGALADGVHTIRVRAIDVLNNQTFSAINSFTVDTVPPVGVTATNPTDGNLAVPEGYFGSGSNNFAWSAGSDPGSGIASYDFWLDGVQRETGLATPQAANQYAIFPGPHTWKVVAHDNAGNVASFNFSFTAVPVPDVTPPNPFNLLTPVDLATVTSPATLTWEAATDFHGIARYDVYIDGAVIGSTAGNVTSYPISAGSGGTPIAGCLVDYDPATSSGCITLPGYAAPWNVAARVFAPPSGSAANSLGVDNYDSNGAAVAAQYQIDVPGTGADLKFSHHYNMQMVGANAYDGVALEMRFIRSDGSWSPWLTTCPVNTTTGVSCADVAGSTTSGSTVVTGLTYQDPTGAAPHATYPFNIITVAQGNIMPVIASGAGSQIGHEAAWSGTSTGMVQETVKLSSFAGKTIQVRWRVAMDTCWTGASAAQKSFCQTLEGALPVAGNYAIDDIDLANPSLAAGVHTWKIRAFDPAGNGQDSNQTWTFTLT